MADGQNQRTQTNAAPLPNGSADGLDDGPAIAPKSSPGGLLRRLLIGVSGLLLLAACFFVGQAVFIEWRIANVRAAPLAEFTIDLGQTGKHEATISTYWEMPCSQYVRLLPPIQETEDADALLKGLQVKASVRDANGIDRIARHYPNEWLLHLPRVGIEIIRDRPSPTGTYTVEVEVTSPAPALAGRPTKVVCAYALCGLERLAAFFSLVLGLAALVPGGLMSLLLWRTNPEKTPAAAAARLHPRHGRQPAHRPARPQ